MTRSLVLLLAVAAPALAQDVPQFRGVGGLGITKETGLPVNFGEKENLRYKVPLTGRGLSNPVIADGRLYLTACSGYQEKQLHVFCFDVKDGKQLWERKIAATSPTLCHPKTNMAAPTPATDGKFVYALFATNDVACFDRDGNLQWYRSLVSDYPTVGNYVGMAASPVLVKDILVVDIVNNGESFAAGLDAKTGENRWRVDRPKQINWVTPLVIRNDGKDEVVLQAGEGMLAVDAATGKERWSVTDKQFLTMPSPTYGDGVIYTPGEKFFALSPGSSKGNPEVLWQTNKLPTGYCSPIYQAGKVYAMSSRGVLNCADAKNGKPLWDMRLQGNFAASPLLAGNRLYVVSEDGQASVVEIAPEQKILATNFLKDTILASPVAANGALFLRSDKYLYCFGAKAK